MAPGFIEIPMTALMPPESRQWVIENTPAGRIGQALVWRPTNDVTKMERFADAETGAGFTLTREAVRDHSTSFALLTSLTMTDRAVVIEVT
jgi:hypothetical protein